ncbi:MAG: hypothetical protein AB1630_11075 [bacterium]
MLVLHDLAHISLSLKSIGIFSFGMSSSTWVPLEPSSFLNGFFSAHPIPVSKPNAITQAIPLLLNVCLNILHHPPLRFFYNLVNMPIRGAHSVLD